jgi:hypothetical protein
MKSKVIGILLDNLLITAEIDPSAISPDDHFQRDLGVNQQQLRKVVDRVASQLKVQNPWKEDQPQYFETPRQLVDHFVALASGEKKVA